MRKKIYSLERQKKDFDKIPLKEIKDMIGFTYPTQDGKWNITLMDKGEGYTCERQDFATIIASLEETKALLIKLLKKSKK